MDIGNRLRMARLRRNMTLAFVGEVLGKTEATVQRYESGNIKNLKLATIERLAMLYDVPPAYLMGWQTEEPLSFSTTYEFYDIDVAAGLPSNVECVLEDDVQKISIPDIFMGKWAGHKDIFFVKANGESMNKVFASDSLLAVKPVELSSLVDNDIVVFSNGSNEYSVKRIIKDFDSQEIIFRPHSKEKTFKDYVVPFNSTETITIHGKVVRYFTEPVIN